MEENLYNSIRIDYESNALYIFCINFRKPISETDFNIIKDRIKHDPEFFISSIEKVYNGTKCEKSKLKAPTAYFDYNIGEEE